MSRIGKLPIKIPEKVKVAVQTEMVKVEGPKGKLEVRIPKTMKVSVKDGHVSVERPDEERQSKSLHGLTRTLINNAIHGVTVGFEETLDIAGVGFRAEAKGQQLSLTVGFSHPVAIELPQGISCDVEKQTRLIVKGIDKHLVGLIASKIRGVKKMEPYKGKGIKYATETILRKAGKTGKK